MPKPTVKAPRQKYHLLTKDEIRTVMNVWESKTIEEISEMMGVDRSRVQRIAKILREEGIPLTRKRIIGEVRSMVREVVEEYKRSK